MTLSAITGAIIGGSLAALALTTAPASTQEASSDWPRWRGARFDGRATATGVFGDGFSLRVRWKRTIGAGYSGVVVAAGRAVTMGSDGKTDFVVALSSDTGEERWRVPLGPTFPPRDGSAGGPVSTPVIHEGTVYALGPRGDLVALGLENGERVWHRQIVTELQAAEPHWGFTTSPLVRGNTLIVMTGGTANRAITAFDRRNGTTVWQSGSDSTSYQSPILAEVGGSERIVAGGDQFLFALDPQNGHEVWRYEHGGRGFYGRIINPVVTAPDRLLLTYRPDETVLLNVGGGSPRPEWTTRELKLNYATPIVHDGVAYGYSGAFLSAVDAATGALLWRSRPPGDGFPILVDGHLVVLTKQGTLAVAKATRTAFTPSASLPLFTSLVWTPPSFADGRVYARDSYAEIAAIDIVPASRMTTTAPPADPARAPTIPSSAFGKWVAEVQSAPDAAARVRAFVDAQKSFPLVEGDKYAHFIYQGPETDIVLRGDMLDTGSEVPLLRVGATDLYYASFELPDDARIAYQFARNLGETVADPRNQLQGTSTTYAGPVSLLLMPRAPRPGSPGTAALRGRMMVSEIETETARAEHLTWGGKRKVHVYLPPAYETESQRRYPTLYVLYGAEMLQGGRMEAMLEREAAAGLEPVIAVFVESTSGFEYARTFRAAHARMMTEQLVPLIDKQYRTMAEAGRRTLVGADEAGFAAVETALRNPHVFGNVLAQSIFPVTKGDEELLALVDQSAVSSQRFHLDWGRFDPRRATDRLDVPGFTRTLADRLRGRGARVTGREWNDGSSVTFWVERAAHGLRELTR